MDFLTDLRFALRVVSRRPGVPALVASLFAVSLGLASGMWAVIDAVAIRPLPYPDAQQLVAVMEVHPVRGRMSVTPANFLDWTQQVSTLQATAGFGGIEASVFTTGDPVRLLGTKVTPGFFDVFRVAPEKGREFHADDFRGDGRIVVISHQVWRRQFGGDPNVIGAPLRIDGVAYTVVGVMPRDFKTIGNAELWVPWIMTPEERTERRFHLVGALARLRPATTPSDADRELRVIYDRLQRDHPDTTADWSARAMPLRDLLLGDARRALAILAAAIVVLIIVASINVAGLLIAWLPTRRQEFVVRMAIGASASRVVRQLLIETLLWAAAGMAGGIGVAVSFVQLFAAVGTSPVLEYDFDPRIDVRVIATMTLLLVVIIAAAALVPCIVSVRRSTDLVPRRARAAGVLGHRAAIVVQVALSVVLLCATAELLIDFDSVLRIAGQSRTAGFGAEISLPVSRYADDSSQRQFFDRLLSALDARREVRSAAAATYIPPARIYGNVRFAIEGRSTPTDALTTLATGVSANAFKLLGIRLLRGRLIDSRDHPDAPRAGVISRALAHRYWPDDDPIGHRLSLVGDPAPITIVGIVDDVRQPLSSDPRAESVLYLSYRQVPYYFMTVLIVPAGELGPALAAVRQEVRRIDPTQAIGVARAIDEIRGEWLEQPRARTGIVTLFGISTLLLALVGLYARVAYAAASRTREFAIRQALGATPAYVVRILTGEALAVVAGGVVIAGALLPATSASIHSIVGGTSTSDLAVAASIAVLFSAAAFASAYWPARRAGRVSPAELLRSE